MARWDHEFVRKVAEEKEAYRGSEDLRNLLNLVTKSIYSDDIHYALELVQNAEDEGASRVDIKILPDHVVIYNDGEPFDEGDVEAICSIKTGFKKNKIGFFGIGFKSVFNITDEPQIISGRYKFRIHDCLYPEPVIRNPRPSMGQTPAQDKGALFILPIKKQKDSVKLVQELEAINDRLLLFLTNVKEITFRDETSSPKREWSIKKTYKDGIVTIENTLLGYNTDWRVFSHKAKVPFDRPEIRIDLKREVEQTNLVIAFPSPNDSGVPDLKSEYLYCFLPTKRRPDMPFLVQADFIPTLARENIDEYNPWNLWLLEEVSKLASNSYMKLREDESFKEHLFNLIRLPNEVGDPLFKGVAEQILEHVKERAIAPLNLSSGIWRKPSGAAIVPNELRHLVKSTELKSIFGNSREQADNAIDNRTREVLAFLGVPEVGLSNVIDLLDISDAIREKHPSWYLDIYDYLATQYEIKWMQNTDYEFKRLGTISFLLTSDRKLVAPNDFIGNDRLLVQHPQTKNLGGWAKMFNEGELVFLDRYFQEAKKDKRVRIDETLEEKRKRVKQFLEGYEVAPSMRPYQVIQRVILPKFASGKYTAYSNEKIILFTNYVRENLIPYINRIRSQRKSVQTDEDAVTEIREALYLKGNYLDDGSLKEGFFPPYELYLDHQGRNPEPIARALLGIERVPFVSPIYYDRRIPQGYTSVPKRGRRQEVVDWESFFTMIGVWKQPRLKKIKLTDLGWASKGKDWVPNQNYTQYIRLCDDKELPDLASLLYHYEGDRKSRHKQVCLFRDLLAEYWEKIYKTLNQSRLEWFYFNHRSQIIYETSFFHQLIQTSWLPVEGIHEKLFLPNQVYFNTPTNESLLPRNTPFIEANENNRSFYLAIGVNERPEKSEVLDHLIQIRHRWIGDQFPTDWAERMGRIYRHLLSGNKEEREGDEFIELIKKFNDDALIFLPSTKGNWWKPNQVFWEDRNDVFGDLRGYLGPYYNEGLKKIFEFVGVAAIPSVHDCVEVLEDLKSRWEREDVDQRRPLKAQVDRIYGEINRLLEMQVGIELSKGLNDKLDNETEAIRKLLNREIYLTDTEEGVESFAYPSEIFYCDDERLRDVATGKVKIIWLQTDWHQYRTLFQKAGVKPLSSIAIVETITHDARPASSEEVQFLRELSQYLRPYLKYHHSKQFIQWDKGEALARLETLDVIATSAMQLQYKLNGQFIEVIPNVPAHYDKLSNSLFVISFDEWLLTNLDYVSTELAQIFEDIGIPLKTQIESLLSGGFDEEFRLNKFKSFGIPKRVADDFIEPILLRLREGRQKPSDIPVSSSGEDMPVAGQVHTTPSTDMKQKTTTVIQTIEELISIENIQGFKGEVNKKQSVVQISVHRPPKRGSKDQPNGGNVEEPRVIKRSPITATETEALAIDLVIAYEESYKRKAEDVHKIQNLGYDVKSAGRFIEIKSFKGEAGQLSFEPSEWDAAEKYREKYYIYIISNLRKGLIPRIRVIRNPFDFVGVYVPGKRIASKWEPAVSEDMEIVIAEEDEGVFAN